MRRGRVAAGGGSWFAGGALEWATGAFSGQAVLDSPHLYFLYLCGAGLGIPLSEDALVVWLGSRLAHGAYSSAGMAATAVATVYAGVVLSDTMTFAFGRMLQKGLFPGMKEKLVGNSAKLAKAQAAIGRWGAFIGVGQRFMVGFRWPLCVVCGFSGVKPHRFLLGSCGGAVLTMALQISAGWLLRGNSHVYLTTLALIAAPTLCGQVLGPILAVVGALTVRSEVNGSAA